MAEVVHAGPRVFVGLGSNLGDRAGHLLLGLRGMTCAGAQVRRLSSIYETEPVGVGDEQPPYLNMVAELMGPNLPPPEQLLARLLRVEYACGRRRERPLAPRTLDLDLLVYGDERRESEYLTLPHPRLHLRRFVLAPLAEVAPELRPRAGGPTARELLAALADSAAVSVWRAA
ncbi:MAG TPA: 2-amino-4-hydroxy-6-hydroxymethyldihydropteridine diphosphokinase [Pyrinomonadaceae bacterium]|nr:2-amino-4-hydroxy-6-hydroxymethyldihydropteridine diphosphokinase [Pyrinomonadaceae bacterium]